MVHIKLSFLPLDKTAHVEVGTSLAMAEHIALDDGFRLIVIKTRQRWKRPFT